MAGDSRLLVLPGPVNTLHERDPLCLMTLQAPFCHLLSGIKSFLEKIAVIFRLQRVDEES